MPASAAQDCMTTFADAIIAKLEEQAEAKVQKAEDAQQKTVGLSSRPHQPFVKITTVKLLAEMLGDTQCIPEEFAISILAKLMVKAPHGDIRRAVVDSLLGMFTDASSQLSEQILTALETTIPIAGNLRERQPITENEWTKAEDTLELPELDEWTSILSTAPMLWSLLSFLPSTPSRQSTYHAAITKRILLPILSSLKQQTAKWTSLFLQKHGFDFAAQQDLNIPPIPLRQEIYQMYLERAPSHLPVSILEEYVAYRTFNMAPPAVIAALNKKFTANPALSRHPEIRSWLSRYSLDLSKAPTRPPPFSPTLLLDSADSLTGEITPKAVQKAFLKLCTVLLWHDSETFLHLEAETRFLWPFSRERPIDRKWAEHYKPIVEAMIHYIDSVRTRGWERDPHRRPSVLPDTFGFRMWLLQYAGQHSDGADSEAHCAGFAARVAKVVEQMAGSMYHGKFAQLKTALGYVRGGDRVRVACYLGDVRKTRLSWLTVQDLLRVELAAGLLEEGKGDMGGDEGLKGRVEALRESWRASGSEEVRRVGFGLSF